ncbi:MAG TPA: sulfotransferase [Terriglobales bacterium]|nr:sulfotransferase [Terriglobales bacterium]
MGPCEVVSTELPVAPAPKLHATTLHELQRGYAPIVILGMHRSGTSLLSRMLEDLGLFLGKSKDENNEAVFFQSVNEWLLRQTGGSWDNPAPIHYLVDSPEIAKRTTAYIRRYLLTSPRAASYTGWLHYLRHRRLTPLSRPWGWKDPRNTFTLPIWLDIFSNAKIIHLHRAGMDVALSLRRRGRREFRLQRWYRSLPLLHWIRPKRGGFVHSLRCDHFDGGLALWNEYMEQGNLHVAALKNRAFDISFETLVREPVRSLTALAGFCELRVDQDAIQCAARLINLQVLSPTPEFQGSEVDLSYRNTQESPT